MIGPPYLWQIPIHAAMGTLLTVPDNRLMSPMSTKATKSY